MKAPSTTTLAPAMKLALGLATKATTFGMGGILLAAALAFGSADIAAQSGLALIFLFLTAPVSAHLISRAAYRTGPHLAPNTTVDDYKPYLEEQAAAQEKQAGEDADGPEESGPVQPSAGKIP